MKTLAKRLDAHFAACAVVAAAAAAGGADAAIVYSGIRNIAIPANVDGVYLNLVTGASAATPVTGWHINPYGATFLGFYTNYPTPDTYFMGNNSAQTGTAVSLTVGSVLRYAQSGSASTASSSMSTSYRWSYSTSAASVGTAAGQWKLNSDNYIGIRSKNSSNEYMMAWMRIAVGATITDRTIVDWAYETITSASAPTTSSTWSLQVGAVPAPGALALLGVAGLVGARRRR